tara:strand:- start:169 stop:405 length:237 start_codon:yes stop_codon:yes gene_type:complete
VGEILDTAEERHELPHRTAATALAKVERREEPARRCRHRRTGLLVERNARDLGAAVLFRQGEEGREHVSTCEQLNLRM